MKRIIKDGWSLPKGLVEQMNLYEGLISTTPLLKSAIILEVMNSAFAIAVKKG